MRPYLLLRSRHDHWPEHRCCQKVKRKPSAPDSLRPPAEKMVTYGYTQRHPDDKEAVKGQGPIALHGLEHLVTSDKGVMLFRNVLRKAIQATAQGEDPKGILRDPAKASLVCTSAGSVVRG